MSLVTPVLVLSLIWAAIHAIHYLLKPLKAKPLLPSAANTYRRWSTSVWNESTTQVDLKSLHLRIHTTAWNLPHDLLAMSLKRNHRHLNRPLKYFYDFGALMGLVGMLGALGFLSLANGMYILSMTHKILWAVSTSPAPGSLDALVKREVGTAEGGGDVWIDESWIKPIVRAPTFMFLCVFPGTNCLDTGDYGATGSPPNYTSRRVPRTDHTRAWACHCCCHVRYLSLLPSLTLTCFLRRESLPILNAGFSFTLAFPSAFVTLSAAGLNHLTPRARVRVIAAGPFHNILFWCLLVCVGYTPLSRTFWSAGYQDISALGRVVVGVDTVSVNRCVKFHFSF